MPNTKQHKTISEFVTLATPNLKSNKRSLLAALLAFLTVIFVAVRDGVLGNAVYDLLKAIWPSLFGAHLLLVSAWKISSIILLALIVFVGCFVSFGNTIKRYDEQKDESKRAMDTLARIIKLDDILLALISDSMDDEDRSQSLEQTLVKVLWELIRMFPDNILRAFISRPDISQEYLEPIAKIQMPEDSLHKAKFYIGPDKQRVRGLVGHAFIERKPLLTHIANNKTPDTDFYHNFEPDRPLIPYKSVIALPIFGKGKEILGILCLDSQEETPFDNQNIQDMLLSVSHRIGSVLIMFERTKHILEPMDSLQVTNIGSPNGGSNE